MNLLLDPAYRCSSWEIAWDEEKQHECHRHMAHLEDHKCECGHSWPRLDRGFLEPPRTARSFD